MKTAAFLIVTVCCIQLTTSVPIELEKLDEIITKESEVPCELDELEIIPNCDKEDKDCDEKNVQKRAKRQTLCDKNPNCSYCGTLIPENLNETDEEPLVVEPEIISPIIIKSVNSTDDEQLELPPDELRAIPQKLIERNIIIENDNETQYYRGYIESGANITTIIRLTNVIKNENIINMPTTLNNTNINNIHIYQNKTSNEGGKFGLGFSENGPCCFAVEAKNCKQSTSGTKCRHKKHKVCGQQCTSQMIHPKKNLCSYTPQWPFVICPNNQPGFNPPRFYPPAFPQYSPGYPQYPPPANNEFDDDDDLPLFPDDDLLENPEGGWIVGPEKCKVVSEDGLQIFNCTNKGVEFEHPYARNTVSESIKREARHVKYPRNIPNQQQQQMQFYPQQMPFYPVMYQPVVMMQPVYLPQYYGQSPPLNYYPSQLNQIPQPPVVDHESYFENDATNEINSYQRPRKHSRKHQPIIIDIDEEL